MDLDPSKLKTIHDLPPTKTKKELMSFLRRLNYICRFIDQSTVICEPIFNFLWKDVQTKWTKEYQKAFETIKSYLLNPLVLLPPRAECPLLLYLSFSDNTFLCVLGKHHKTWRKERVIYYLTSYESPYTLLEMTYSSLTWVVQKVRHYL